MGRGTCKIPMGLHPLTWRLTRTVLVSLVAFALASCGGGDSRQPVDVSLLAINDFHGYLLPAEQLTMNVPDPDGGPPVEVRVGGAAYLASMVKELRASNPHSLFVGVGDFVGGAPPISAFTAHESTIEVMNQIGLAVTPVGNHEFDRGKRELKRLQQGGCLAKELDPQKESCRRTGSFPGASFPFLAANVVDNDTGQLLFPATHIARFGEATVGFIGLTLEGTPSTTRGAGGLTFKDEVEVISDYASRLKSDGVDAVIVLLHQGSTTTASSLTDRTCPGLAGEFRTIVEALPPQVDVVLSAHTHADYLCEINGILVSQAGSFGRMATRVDLTIKPGQGVLRKTANNIPVINDQNTKVPRGYKIYQADPEIAKLVAEYDGITRATREAVVGYVAAPDGIRRTDIDSSGNLVVSGSRINVADHPIGRLMTDAFLAVRGPNNEVADVAVMNPGGLRSTLAYSASNGGAVTYDALYTLAPFGNALQMVELSGESLIRLLEQQWEAPNCEGRGYRNICGRVLQVSSTLKYTWRYSPEDQGKPVGTGAMVDRSTVMINDKPIALNGRYKVITVDFVADGGNNYTVMADPKHRLSFLDMATTDMEALLAYFARSGSKPLSAPPARITCKLKSNGGDCGIPVL